MPSGERPVSSMIDSWLRPPERMAGGAFESYHDAPDVQFATRSLTTATTYRQSVHVLR